MKLGESFRKNKEDIQGIFLKAYPEFVFKKMDKQKLCSIPVFTFHHVIAEKFERQLKYLYENNYKTIDADTLICVLSGEIKPDERTIVLTFDDGLSSLWTIIYPLLKKYRFVGVSFLIPFLIEEQKEYYPNLENVRQNGASIHELSGREKKISLCTWNEIYEMHNSGIIDFQSHSSYHSSVFINDKLI